MIKEKGVPIVIDNGSEICKAGFSGDSFPRSIDKSVVGLRNDYNGMWNERMKS